MRSYQYLDARIQRYERNPTKNETGEKSYMKTEWNMIEQRNNEENQVKRLYTIVKGLGLYRADTWRCTEVDNRRLQALEMDALRFYNEHKD